MESVHKIIKTIQISYVTEFSNKTKGVFLSRKNFK